MLRRKWKRTVFVRKRKEQEQGVKKVKGNVTGARCDTPAVSPLPMSIHEVDFSSFQYTIQTNYFSALG